VVTAEGAAAIDPRNRVSILLFRSLLLLPGNKSKKLRSGEWAELSKEEFGMTEGRFYELKKELESEGKVVRSLIDERWERIRALKKPSRKEL
jgi:hypothetical protein